LLVPEQREEIEGVVPHVLFPTAIDRRADLGTEDLFDIYYGMADSRIGVARLNPSARRRETTFSSRPGSYTR
jgi:predicted GH43/DUF377 family glycosyl hydrolase